MTTTVRRKAADIRKAWHVVDASDRALGRVASEVAVLLRGKHKPTYEPHLDDGDFVIIINASKVRLSGRKAEQKVYFRHSGYPGGLHERTFAEQMARRPERVLERAVRGMLPKGPLGKRLRRHLKVYPSAEHPHESQIVGAGRASEAITEAEAEAFQALIENPPKPPRLRPLGVPVEPRPRPTRGEKVAAHLAQIEEARAAAEADAEAIAGQADDESGEADVIAEVATDVEDAVVAEPATDVEDAVAAEPADAGDEQEEEAPKPRRRRSRAKAVTAEDEVVAEAPKPRRRRSRTKAAAEDEVVAEPPKPRRRSRAKAAAEDEAVAEAPAAAAEDAEAEEKPKPRRRRRAKAEPAADASEDEALTTDAQAEED